jgi:DNA repair protein RadC
MTTTSSLAASDTMMVRDVTGRYRVAIPDEVLNYARILLAQSVKRGECFSSPQMVKDYLSLQIGTLEHEVFCVLFLDAQHRVIQLEEMFRGTVTETAVYPREIVKEALRCNAHAVILAHNHPTGSLEPSRADERLTDNLKAALSLVDVRVLDHLVVGTTGAFSFAEQGLL